MQTTTTQSHKMSVVDTANTALRPWLMLFSRSVLFLSAQVLIMLIAAVAGRRSVAEAWDESARWWTFMAFLANAGSLYLLVKMFQLEGKNYWDILRFSPANRLPG
jgi:hypothetical protein